MGRGRHALATGLALLQLGALGCGALGPAQRSRAAGGMAEHADPASAGQVEEQAPHPGAGAPCHEAHGSGAKAPPRVLLTLNERCPCGCGGFPGAALDHGSSGIALLAFREALDLPRARTAPAIVAARATQAPARSVDHVPIPA